MTTTCLRLCLIMFTTFMPLTSRAIKISEAHEILKKNSVLLSAKEEKRNFYKNIYLSQKYTHRFYPLLLTSFTVLDELYVGRIHLSENLYDGGFKSASLALSQTSYNMTEIESEKIVQELYINILTIFIEALNYKSQKEAFSKILEEIKRSKNYLEKSIKYKVQDPRYLIRLRDLLISIEIRYDSIVAKLNSISRSLRFTLKKEHISFDDIEDPTLEVNTQFAKMSALIHEYLKTKDVKINNLELKMLEEKTKYDDQKYRVQLASYLPIVNLSIGANIYKDRTKTYSQNIKLDYMVLLDFSWPLFSSVSKNHLKHAHREQERSSKLMYSHIRSKAKKTLEAKYYEILKLEKYLEIDIENQKLINSIINKNEEIFYTGALAPDSYIHLLVKKLNLELNIIDKQYKLVLRKAELITDPDKNFEEDILSNNYIIDTNYINNNLEITNE
jgi:outer membrane protein TolC